MTEPDQGRGWLARKVLPGGEEPDPRFTLANERTFLAWVRTALAFLAGGLALEAFAIEAFPEPLRKVLAVLLVAIGMLISAGAQAMHRFCGWSRGESLSPWRLDYGRSREGVSPATESNPDTGGVGARGKRGVSGLVMYVQLAIFGETGWWDE